MSYKSKYEYQASKECVNKLQGSVILPLSLIVRITLTFSIIIQATDWLIDWLIIRLSSSAQTAAILLYRNRTKRIAYQHTFLLEKCWQLTQFTCLNRGCNNSALHDSAIAKNDYFSWNLMRSHFEPVGNNTAATQKDSYQSTFDLLSFSFNFLTQQKTIRASSIVLALNLIMLPVQKGLGTLKILALPCSETALTAPWEYKTH